MKIIRVIFFLLFSSTAFSASVTTLEDYYREKLSSTKNYTQRIIEIDEYVDGLNKAGVNTAEECLLMSFLLRTRVLLEGKQAYKVEKKLTKSEWFESEQFHKKYDEISEYTLQALNSDSSHLFFSYKEISKIISSPFLAANIKEVAQKLSLLIMKNEGLGGGEHPLSHDQFVGRVYKMMMQDYCAEKKCSEVRRLSKELAGYSEKNRELSEELLRSYEGLIEKEDQTLTEVSRNKVDKKDILIKTDDTVGKSKLGTEPEAVNEQENINGADKLKSITSLKSDPVEKYVLEIVVFLLIVMMVFWVGRRRKM